MRAPGAAARPAAQPARQRERQPRAEREQHAPRRVTAGAELAPAHAGLGAQAVGLAGGRDAAGQQPPRHQRLRKVGQPGDAREPQPEVVVLGYRERRRRSRRRWPAPGGASPPTSARRRCAGSARAGCRRPRRAGPRVRPRAPWRRSRWRRCPSSPISGCASRNASWRASRSGAATSSASRRAMSGARASDTPSFNERVRPSWRPARHAQAGVGEARERLGRVVGGAVVDDDQLQLGERLAENAAHRVAHPRRAVANRQHDGHPRRRACAHPLRSAARRAVSASTAAK